MPATDSWLDHWGWNSIQAQPISAYIHVPFCRHRCGYCNFSLLANRDDLFDRYLQAMQTELSALREPRAVQTIFLGGGTPSILPRHVMEPLVKSIQEWLPWELGQNYEFSLEANPLDITKDFCRLCQDLGFNRISIGGQSFQSAKLSQLERDHSPQQLVQAFEIAQAYFSSVSIDLIFGSPGESLDDWRRDLERVIELGPHHVSTYGLTYEKGAKFWSRKEKGLLQAASEELELSMYELAMDTLQAAGYEHYEVSNFAQPEHHCRHNESYWKGLGWWAFGPSAARFVGTTRSVNHRGTMEYLRRVEAGNHPTTEWEQLSDDQILRERFVFGMRQLDGVNWSRLSCEGPLQTVEELSNLIQKHIESGWMEMVGEQVRLTRQGLVLSDGLWSEYL